MFRRRFVLALLLSGLLGALPAGATLYVMPSDETLVDEATAIVEGRIVVVGDQVPTDLPATTYRVEVLSALKGAPESPLSLVVPGGFNGEGLMLSISGAPRFELGSRVLLFLVRDPRGSWRSLHLMLGSFHVFDVAGRELAVRDLTSATAVAHPVTGELGRREQLPRDRAGFVAWISDRVAGRRSTQNYFIEPDLEAKAAITERFSIIRDRRTGLGIRFFEFDSGGQVDWYFHGSGQAGLSGGGVSELRRALNLWNGESRTPLQLVLRGATSASGGLTRFDGVNALIFGDPDNLLNSPYNCAQGGGVLAFASPWLRVADTGRFRGNEYHRALGADIVTNRGLDCFFTRHACNASEAAEAIFAHELGHTLGLGHSCDGRANPCDTPDEINALLAPFIHNDCRTTRLERDDLKGIRFLYEQPAGPPPPTPPAAPSGLAAEALGPGAVQLSWTDLSTNEAEFELESRLVAALGEGGFSYQGATFTSLGTVLANETRLLVQGLEANTTYNFRLRAKNTAGNSAFSAEATATTLPVLAPDPCAPGAANLCLLGGRFEVVALWNNFRVAGAHGDAMALPGTDRSGFFWFFSPSNTELVVKMLDASALGGGFWYFSGALSDVEYWVVVTDTTNRHRKTYYNPPRNVCGVGDTSGLPASLAHAGGARSPLVKALPVPVLSERSALETCVPGPETLCLLGNRFAVEVDWKNQHAGGTTGVGGAIPSDASDRTGFFWFFNPANLELVVKILDGTASNGHFWVFFGSLSDVEYNLHVTDTQTGASVTYHNNPGNLCGGSDTEAFDG